MQLSRVFFWKHVLTRSTSWNNWCSRIVLRARILLWVEEEIRLDNLPPKGRQQCPGSRALPRRAAPRRHRGSGRHRRPPGAAPHRRADRERCTDSRNAPSAACAWRFPATLGTPLDAGTAFRRKSIINVDIASIATIHLEAIRAIALQTAVIRWLESLPAYRARRLIEAA